MYPCVRLLLAALKHLKSAWTTGQSLEDFGSFCQRHELALRFLQFEIFCQPEYQTLNLIVLLKNLNKLFSTGLEFLIIFRGFCHWNLNISPKSQFQPKTIYVGLYLTERSQLFPSPLCYSYSSSKAYFTTLLFAALQNSGLKSVGWAHWGYRPGL